MSKTTSVQNKQQFLDYKEKLESRGLILPVWWDIMGKTMPTPEDFDLLHIRANEES